MDTSEVWNRNTGGASSDLLGDQHLARAIAFDSHAEGDGVLEAVEALVGELLVDETIEAFEWFGLHDVARLVSDTASPETADPDEARVDEDYQRMAVTERLSQALEVRLRDDAESFSPPGTEDTRGPSREFASGATVVSHREKALRTVMTLNAFGIGAVVLGEGGVRLVDAEPDDLDDSLDDRIADVLDLMDRWFVTADELEM